MHKKKETILALVFRLSKGVKPLIFFQRLRLTQGPDSEIAPVTLESTKIEKVVALKPTLCCLSNAEKTLAFPC